MPHLLSQHLLCIFSKYIPHSIERRNKMNSKVDAEKPKSRQTQTNNIMKTVNQQLKLILLLMIPVFLIDRKSVV